MTDIRLQTDFLSGHKAKKLKRLVGADGVLGLVRLWCWTANNRPTGDLTRLDKTDIAINADWDGDVDEYIDALVAVGFLDEADGIYSIHDWKDHQPFVYNFEKRSKQAKKAAQARWGTDDADSNPEKEISNTPTPIPIPSPNPDPKPKPIPTPDGDKNKVSQSDYAEVKGFLYHSEWNQVLNTPGIKGWLTNLIKAHGKEKILAVLPGYFEWWKRNMSHPPKQDKIRQYIWKRCEEAQLPEPKEEITPEEAWEDFG